MRMMNKLTFPVSGSDAFQMEKRQVNILTKHFFKRFFENDDLTEDGQAGRKLRIVLVLMGFLGGYLALALLKPYLGSADRSASWVEKSYLIGFYMLIMAIFDILQWKTMNLDGRDFNNLAVLPIKPRVLFLSKYLSLLRLMSLFFIATTALPALIFPMILLRGQAAGVLGFLRFFLVHLSVFFLAYLFVLSVCGLLDGFFCLLLKSAPYRRISAYLQIILLIGLTFAMIILVAFFTLYPEIYSSFPSLLRQHPERLRALPFFWFGGLYESLLGNPEHLFDSMARTALGVTVLGCFLHVGLAVLNYRKHLRPRGESDRTARSFKGGQTAGRLFNALFLPTSTQRAVFHFVRITLKRIAKYKLIIGGYAAVAFSLFLVLLMTLGFKMSHEDFLFHDKLVLIFPHIVTIFLLAGSRAAANFPETLEANWIFKITEIREIEAYRLGLKKAVFFLVILPSYVLLFVLYQFLLPVQVASIYLGYGLLNSSIAVAVCFFGYAKIPFACGYGTRGLGLGMIRWLAGGAAYVFAASGTGYRLLKRPDLFPYYGAFAVLLLIGIQILEKRIAVNNPRLAFEEIPDCVGFKTL